MIGRYNIVAFHRRMHHGEVVNFCVTSRVLILTILGSLF